MNEEHNVDSSNIVSYKLTPKKLKIIYLRDVFKSKNKKSNRLTYKIKKVDLEHPPTWEEFEKIFHVFRETVEKEKAKPKKMANLHPDHGQTS